LRRAAPGSPSSERERGAAALDGWFGAEDDGAFGAFLLQNWDAVVRACRLEKNPSTSTLTREECASLDFLFETRDERGEKKSIAECAMEDAETIECDALREWIRNTIDPASVSCSALSSKDSVSAVSAVAAVAEMASTSGQSGSKTLVTIENAYKTTIVRRHGSRGTHAASTHAAMCRTSPRDLPTYGAEDYDDDAVPFARVVDCTDSIVYLLEPYDYVTIAGCTDCVVIVGAVSRSMRVEGCERVKLICAAKRVVVRSCFECTFHLGILNQPMFVGDNRKCVLGPYNTFYEHLDEHLTRAKLKPEACNAWDRPVVLGADLPIQDGSSSPSTPDVVRISSGVSLMSPDAFTMFIIPFRERSDGESPMDQDGGFPSTPSASTPTQANPFETPANYVAALEAKMELICEVRARVRDAPLSETKRSELKAVIQSHFKAWLQSSGMSREIFDLSAVEREEIRARATADAPA
jgi:TBCC domain-containing protein 1